MFVGMELLTIGSYNNADTVHKLMTGAEELAMDEDDKYWQ
jgi:hypothetical protein